MSAATEELLEQITRLEVELQKAELSYGSEDSTVLNIKAQLFELREQLTQMNESLKDQKNILKG